MRRQRWLWQLTLFVIGMGIAPLAAADIFIMTEESGEVSLSNIPDDNRYEVLIKTPEASITASQQALNVGIAANSTLAQTRPFGMLVEETARTHKVDAALLHAVITAESGYNPRAVSRKGASGLMQLMPATAKRYGVSDRYDPTENVRGGARYLKDLLGLYKDDVQLTLAAYNAGEHAVTKYGMKIPPYGETMRYVNTVMKLYDQYRISSQ